MNAVLVFFMIFSIMFYVYYKCVYFFRAKYPAEKKWLSAKSSIALGLFVALFGLNAMINPTSTWAIVVGILFILIGSGSIWAGSKAYKFYLPHAREEAELIRQQQTIETTK